MARRLGRMMRGRAAWGVGCLTAVIVGVAAAVALGGAGAGAGEVHTQQAVAAERTVGLGAGFNLVGWPGGDPIAAGEAASAIPGATALFDFNGATQQFRSYRPGAPAVLNTLAEIAPGSAVWVQTDGLSEWIQPARTEPYTITLEPGFNLVVWTGPSGTAVEEAVEAFAPVLLGVFRYEGGQFTSYGPGRPAFLNTLTELNYGDGLYVQVDHGTFWEQPAAPAGGRVSLLGGRVDVTAPVGMDAGTLSAISVREIEASELPEALRGVTPVGPVVDISGPEGELPTPLEVCIYLTAEEVAGLQPEGGSAGFVLLTVDAEGNPELLGDPTTTVSLEDGRVSVSGEATHFSPVVTAAGRFNAYWTQQLPAQIPVPTSGRTIVRMEVSAAAVVPSVTYLGKIGTEGPLVLHPFPFAGLSFSGPVTVVGQGPEGGGVFESFADWDCVRVGPDTYGASVRFVLEVEDLAGLIIGTLRSGFVGVRAIGEPRRTVLATIALDGSTECIPMPATFALFDNAFQPTANIFIGPHVHVVSTPEANLDMQAQLPITLRLVNLFTGETHEWTIPNDPVNYCEGVGECSTPIDALGTIERGSVWRLTATGQDGTTLAQEEFTAE